MNQLYRRLTEAGPKRILALDGGGVRGILSLAFLSRMEGILRERHENPKLTLADYFDLIGGTSTGAIIASALALGKEVEWIQEKYHELAESVFRDKKTWGGILRAKYDVKILEAALNAIFKEITLGSDEIQTGLCIVTKRADTNSTWPFFNHPEGRYFRQNCDFPLKLLIRASTAAPTYFASETIEGEDTGRRRFKGEFVDGGVSMHNNPALLLFHLATKSGYPFSWPTGEDKMLLISVGTGYWGIRGDRRGPLRSGVGWAKLVAYMLMEDANWHNQQVLQSLSSSPTAVAIDSEMGALERDLLGGEALLSYLRFDVPLERKKLEALNLVDMPFDVESAQALDGAANIEDLDHLGQVAAGKMMHGLHVPRCFDRT